MDGKRPPADAPAIAVSSGEPAGIGPDICLALAGRAGPVRIAVLGDPEVLSERAAQLGCNVEIRVRSRIDDVTAPEPGALQVLPVSAAVAVAAGRLDPRNADYVLELLRQGVALCRGGGCAALVTAPVQKSVINQAGIPFTGHTEYLAQMTGAKQPVMLLASTKLRVALATTHLPLAAVPAAIDADRLTRILLVIDRDMRRLFGLVEPRILVLGLNPHAGENGTLGSEESTVIAPVVEQLTRRGLRLLGPVSADTAFTEERLSGCDVVLAMYHDQGLPVLKALAFGDVVNVTLGLPIIRTSVDHGTALPLAGSGKARDSSLQAAVDLAAEFARAAAAA